VKRFASLLLLALFTQTPLMAQGSLDSAIEESLVQSLAHHIKGKNRPLIENIYHTTGDKPLWIGEVNAKKTSELIQALNNPFFNYKNKNFDRTSISKLYYLLDNNEVTPSQRAKIYARLDLLLTSSMIRLVRFIVQGDVDWALVQQKFKALKESDDIKVNWEMSPHSFPDVTQLIIAIEEGEIQHYLETLIPMQKRYAQLIHILKNYRKMEKFPKIAYTQHPLKLGDRSSDVIQIKKRLRISGDYPQDAPLDKKFNLALQKAVMTYQKRYLIEVTGMVDKTTTWYLNQPVKKNIQAIITNLDKTKLYPRHFEEEYVEVNVPDFNLRYYQKGKRLVKMGIVVGRIDRPTPIFSDKIEYMVINPTWTIPDNLVKRDLIHVLHQNPDYLTQHNIHVFQGQQECNVTQAILDPYEKSSEPIPYRFVQFPGKDNALGRIKFMFPNRYAVYLHDTDNKDLFKRRYKVYSSGCMRIAKPFVLMDILLEHTKERYSRQEIEEILATNEPKIIKLHPEVPVHILYFTVYEEDGLTYFKHDIYLYDTIIQESTQTNHKPTFHIPKKRMIRVKAQRQKQLPPNR